MDDRLVLIAIEGTDGTGKSTLAEELKARIVELKPDEQVIVKHFGPPERHPLTEYEEVLDAYVPGTDTTVILDRFHWGEMVYSEIYRGGSKLGGYGFWHVEQAMQARGGVMIWADGDSSRVLERQIALKEDFLQPQDALKVQAEFARLAMEESTQTVFRFDSTVPLEEQWPLDDLILRAMIKERYAMRLPRGYVGPVNPELLLVGERPNQFAANRPRGHTTAFVPYPESSGRYLIEQVILPLPIEERALVGLFNSYDAHTEESNDVHALWVELGCPEVCALGKTPCDVLEAQGVPHREAPHPQYWRRFRHSDGAEYRELVLGRTT